VQLAHSARETPADTSTTSESCLNLAIGSWSNSPPAWSNCIWGQTFLLFVWLDTGQL